MYLRDNLQNRSGGEHHSSYHHYSMSQINDEMPMIHREYKEHSQTWGEPLLSSSTFDPVHINSDRNFSYLNHAPSNSSSLSDRNKATLHDNVSTRDSTDYLPKRLANQHRDLGISTLPGSNTFRQQSSASSSYSQTSNTSRQSQIGTRHFHDVPYFHGFKFQFMPG